MFRKFVIAALLALAVPLVVTAAAGAEQYPPDVDGTTIPRDLDDEDPPTSADPSGADPSGVARADADPAEAAEAAEAAAPQAESAPEGTGPLARTGTDTGVLIAAGLVLVVGGGVAVASTRRRRALG